MKIFLLLLSITIPAMTEAQTPPMPPQVLMVTNTFLTNYSAIKREWHRPSRFTFNCPTCRISHRGQIPFLVVTNGWHSTNGGNICERTMDFQCPDSAETIHAKNTIFVPESIAVEELDAPAQLPSGAGAGDSIQTWTTNANLRLSIEILNKTNVLTLTGVTNNSTISNTITLGIIPGPMAAIRFPTELGKSYKCQATDDAKKTWLDGPIVAGTGHFVTNYEMPVKISRIYRVVENPL